MPNDGTAELDGITLTGLKPLIKEILTEEIRNDPAFTQAMMAALLPQLRNEFIKFARSNNNVGTLTPR